MKDCCLLYQFLSKHYYYTVRVYMYFITFHLTLDVQFTLMQYDIINLHHLNNIYSDQRLVSFNITYLSNLSAFMVPSN